MKILQSNNPVYFDIDNTLVREITDADSKGFLFTYVNHPLRANAPTARIPLKANIQLLKDMSARHRTIVVWSANGWQWAEAVIKALELENHVHYVIEKPIAYVDDLDASTFMGQRIFLQE